MIPHSLQLRPHAVILRCLAVTLGVMLGVMLGVVGCGGSPGSTAHVSDVPGGSDASPKAAQSAKTAPVAPAPAVPASLGDAESAALKERLIWAVSVAELFPCPPFERDQARLKHSCVDAAVARGWADSGRTIARSIEGWRRGEAQVAVARALDAAGRSAEANELIDETLKLDRSTWPDWSRARVMSACAKYRLQRGDDRLAMELLRGPDANISGELQVARTALMPPENLEEQEKMFERGIATLNFDLARTGIDGQFELLRRWRDRPADFDRVLAASKAASKGLPIDLQVRYECDLAVLLHSLDRRDAALEALKRGSELASSTQFLPEDVVPIGKTVVSTQARLGLGAEARSGADSLERKFAETESTIFDMKRATSLRALAEVRAELGDMEAARNLYLRAIEVSQINPNSRPRADDLCLVVCSMVTSGVAADERMDRALNLARTRLGAPW